LFYLYDDDFEVVIPVDVLAVVSEVFDALVAAISAVVVAFVPVKASAAAVVAVVAVPVIVAAVFFPVEVVVFVAPSSYSYLLRCYNYLSDLFLCETCHCYTHSGVEKKRLEPLLLIPTCV
jgi:hypothetical protein